MEPTFRLTTEQARTAGEITTGLLRVIKIRIPENVAPSIRMLRSSREIRTDLDKSDIRIGVSNTEPASAGFVFTAYFPLMEE
jgi:hypothetical protein